MRKHSGRVILSTLFNVIRQTSLPFTNVNNKLKGNLGKNTLLILKMRYAIYFQTEDIRGVLKNTFQIEDNIS
jgi:hypothetical protein